MPGGGDGSKDARNHRVYKAHDGQADAEHEVGQAEAELAVRQTAERQAFAALVAVEDQFERARVAHIGARDDYLKFIGSQDPAVALTEAGKQALQRLRDVLSEAGEGSRSARSSLMQAEAAYNEAAADVARARVKLEFARDKLGDAQAAVSSAEGTSY